MKKYKHKITGETVEQKGDYYTIDGKSLKKEWVENSCDWEEVKELPFKVGDTFIHSTFKDTLYRIKNIINGSVTITWECNQDSSVYSIDSAIGYFEDGTWIKQEDFVLPKNWYVVVTDENRETVSRWYSESKKLEKGNICGVCRLTRYMGSCYEKMSAESTNSIKTYCRAFLQSDFGQEITFEQFKKHVLGEKLFTTEDGVDIYKDFSYYCVNTKTWSLFQQKAKERTQLNKGVLAFANKENAEDYRINNYPCLTLEESSYPLAVRKDFIRRKIREQLSTNDLQD
jgi:hypothetical protein